MGATLFTNGKIFQSPGGTAKPTSPKDAEAVFHACMLVADGVIRHVGAETDEPVLAARQDPQTEIRDLQGKTVLPGFVDGHMHLLMLGQALKKAGLEACKSLDDILAAIRAWAAAHPEAPRILCRGWMHSMTPGGVSAAALDALGDPRPIFIDSKDLHSTWCSTAALEDMGIDANGVKTPDPPGGTIQRDDAGRPTGLLSEAAAFNIVWPHVARSASLADRVAAIRAAVEAYGAAGYTGMVEMAMDETSWEALLQAVREAKSDGEGGEAGLPVRISAYWLVKPSGSAAANLAQVERAAALSREYNAATSSAVRVVGIKLICDGIIDACTAALREPYCTMPSSHNYGATIWAAEELRPVVKAASEAGLQVALHAIGDAAISMAVSAIEAGAPPSLRPRVEHLEMASAADAARLGKLGITASIQPVHADPAILRAWPKLLGDHRCGRAFAYREFADGGAPLALGSDAPTAPYPPLANAYVGTTRRSAREPEVTDTVNPHFALGLCEAVAAATHGAAYSCFADAWCGRLEKGMKADFAVVDMAWEKEALLKARVKETWFEGRKVFEDQV